MMRNMSHRMRSYLIIAALVTTMLMGPNPSQAQDFCRPDFDVSDSWALRTYSLWSGEGLGFVRLVPEQSLPGVYYVVDTYLYAGQVFGIAGFAGSAVVLLLPNGGFAIAINTCDEPNTYNGLLYAGTGKGFAFLQLEFIGFFAPG